jgi:hypothetical protein
MAQPKFAVSNKVNFPTICSHAIINLSNDVSKTEMQYKVVSGNFMKWSLRKLDKVLYITDRRKWDLKLNKNCIFGLGRW